MSQMEPDLSKQKLCQAYSMLPHNGIWYQAEVWRQALAQYNLPRGNRSAWRIMSGIAHTVLAQKELEEFRASFGRQLS